MKNPNATLSREQTIRAVATLDMVGTLTVREMAGDTPPAEVKQSSLLLLRAVRDTLAALHNLGPDNQFLTAEFQADMMLGDLVLDGTIDRRA